MCMYVVFCKIDHCIHTHWCIVMGLGHNDPWVESHMWPQQTWGQRSSRGQWPLVQVFGKKGQCIHILWCIFKSNITMIAKVCDHKSRWDTWFENRLVFSLGLKKKKKNCMSPSCGGRLFFGALLIQQNSSFYFFFPCLLSFFFNFACQTYMKRHDRHNKTLWTIDFFNSVFCLVSCSSKNQVPHFILNKVLTDSNLTRLLLGGGGGGKREKNTFRSGLPISHKLWDIFLKF